jgi:hypothetical protein
LTVAAGLAAGVTLLLALRRQMLSERAQRFAENDAVEQRTTALYVAAADQLGSDKAAVRLAGLYALERVGQNNPKLRQTVVDVWCAYLRMPFDLPRSIMPTKLTVAEKGSRDVMAEDDRPKFEEFEVRQTAQRLLKAHLSADPTHGTRSETVWRNIDETFLDLDLTSAVLVDFDLQDCCVGVISLRRARIIGDLRFERTHVTGYANFHSTHFHGYAWMSDVRFHTHADFGESRFLNKASFVKACFSRQVSFYGTKFHGEASFYACEFHGHVSWHEAAFFDLANMRDVRMLGPTTFHGVDFRKGVLLENAQFTLTSPLPAGWVVKEAGSGVGMAVRVEAEASPETG